MKADKYRKELLCSQQVKILLTVDAEGNSQLLQIHILIEGKEGENCRSHLEDLVDPTLQPTTQVKTESGYTSLKHNEVLKQHVLGRHYKESIIKYFLYLSHRYM